MRPGWRATYRLQFHKGFTFDDALAIVPYLAAMGVSHVYASPIFKARPGSTHGYDVIDPSRINPELGGREAFLRLSTALRAQGMGLLLDIVPNHMAAHQSNPCWMAALAGGPRGPAADIFDIDWEAHPQVLLPVLGDTLEATLAQGGITLTTDYEHGWILASAYGGEHAWPLRPEDAAALLQEAGLAVVAARWRTVGLDEYGDANKALCALDEAQRALLARVLEQQDMPAILARQHWRPAHWRTARDALSWRRFFNITELVGVRVEQAEVFALTHQLALKLLRGGLIDGLRIDHIDGLADPAGYCRRLRIAAGPDALIVVEKILGHGEAIRPGWPIDGTSGYERLNSVNRVFVAPEGYAALSGYLERRGVVTGEGQARLVTAKQQMLAESFGPELDQLSALAGTVATGQPGLEYGLPTLRRALSALLVKGRVYRSYLTSTSPSEADAALWKDWLEEAVIGVDGWTAEAVRWLGEVILIGEGPEAAELRCRFQQLSGPMMAKGLEDTEFYRAVALTSVNEVGGELDEAGGSIEEFHAMAQARAKAGACDLTPLATHDTKRGPEVRARLNLLSLDPEGWIAAYERWSAMNAGLRGPAGPDAADEWLIYQTILGAWPIDAPRLREYLTKAMREAKRHTRWEDANEAYESSVLDFAAALLDHPDAAPFREDMAAMVERLLVPGRVNGLAQTILQLAMPGVPDIYQGTEWWDLSLVDPDNRRPVDYGARLSHLSSGLPRLATDTRGVLKQRVTQRLLTLRRDRPALFEGYEPLALPPGEAGWLGFARGGGRLLVVLPTRAVGSEVPPVPAMTGCWRDVLLDRSFDSKGLSGDWPFLVLAREGS